MDNWIKVGSKHKTFEDVKNTWRRMFKDHQAEAAIQLAIKALEEIEELKNNNSSKEEFGSAQEVFEEVSQSVVTEEPVCDVIISPEGTIEKVPWNELDLSDKVNTNRVIMQPPNSKDPKFYKDGKYMPGTYNKAKKEYKDWLEANNG